MVLAAAPPEIQGSGRMMAIVPPDLREEQIQSAEAACEAEAQLLRAQVAQLKGLQATSNVATKLLNETSTKLTEYLDAQPHVLKILRAGYREVDLPTGQQWAEGYVEDPRTVKSPLILSGLNWVGVASLIGAVVAFSGLAIWSGNDKSLSNLWLLIPGGLLLLSVATLFTRMGIDSINGGRARAAGINDWQPLFLKTAPPAEAMQLYRQAIGSGLFETIKVSAPRSAFNQASALDPIIYGTYKGRNFQIVRYGMAEDLQALRERGII